jgi:hypothetical protein
LSGLPAWLSALLWAGAIGLVIYVLHLAMTTGTSRSALRGGGSASGLAGRIVDAGGKGILAAQALVEPDKRHLAEQRDEQSPEQDDEAGPR